MNTELVKQIMFPAAFLLAGSLIFLFPGCASQKAATRVSQYIFEESGNTVRIRSINAENVQDSYNEIITDQFVARDVDQNGIVDKIVLGDVSLAEAQRVYDAGIRSLRNENRLHERSPANGQFRLEKGKYRFFVKSFPQNGIEQFNEFTIIDRRQSFFPVISVAFDNGADGYLDQVLKGPISLKEAQEHYDNVVREGLERGRLIRRNNRITVAAQ